MLLSLHSLFRWIVLAMLLLSLFRSLRGRSGGRVFTQFDNTIRHSTATAAHIQLLLGIGLYWNSPLTRYFMDNFREAVHQREIRFFGMEHSSMMLLAIILLTIGSMRTKRKLDDREKFRTMSLWFGIALLIILSSIPWAFSPLISRPWFRTFW